MERASSLDDPGPALGLLSVQLVMRGAGDHRLELGTRGTLHRCLDYVLEELKHNAKAKVMVASHNEDTVRFTLRR